MAVVDAWTTTSGPPLDEDFGRTEDFLDEFGCELVLRRKENALNDEDDVAGGWRDVE